MRQAALLWLLVVISASLYFAFRITIGVEFQTDLFALLPHEERDGGIQRAKNRITEIYERRVIALVGHQDRARARSAGETIAQRLDETGLMDSVTYRVTTSGQDNLGSGLFSYRRGLLSSTDRARLLENREAEIVSRALGTLFSPAGFSDSRLLQTDPFLLFPAFLTELPVPFPKVTLDDGVLTVQHDRKTYVLVAAQLRRDAVSYSSQSTLVAAFDATERALLAKDPDLVILRTGALFYSNAGAQTAIAETSWISVVSILGTVLLILVVFRALRPLWFSLLSVLVGVLVAFAISLWIFDSLHIASLLFGTSLIGIAVDYSLHYVCDGLDTKARPQTRIRRVFPGLFLGLATTLIGYLTLLWAPFPGLHQVAAFVAIGLTASFATVVLWLPFLDRGANLPPPKRGLGAIGRLWRFWNDPGRRQSQAVLVALCTLLALLGASRFSIDDDVRRLQRLPPALQSDEAHIRELTGLGTASQFILVRGKDQEAVLQREEALAARLAAIEPKGPYRVNAISLAVPSRKRQEENVSLVNEKLYGPALDAFYARIGMARPAIGPTGADQLLTLDAAAEVPALSFIRRFIVETGPTDFSHLVLADIPIPSGQLQEVVRGLDGVAVVDPVEDFTRLFGAYRRRALALLIFSAALAVPLLAWRYGVVGSVRVMLPSVAAVAVTPALVALSGAPFTFFNAIGLILVFSVGIDYAIFCREADDYRVSSTMLGIFMAAATTIMSFGLLAFSSVYAVHAFGITISVGIILAFFLAPLARHRTFHP